MSEDKVREEFEAWYLREYFEGDEQCGIEWLSTEPCGGYRYSDPAKQWKIWQASRASCTVKLPGIMVADDHWTGDIPTYIAGEVVEAIEAAGVKVKP